MNQTPSDDLDDRDKPTPDWTRPPEPALHRAARKGDTARIAQLLAEGADIEERADVEFDGGPHHRGLTALMVAARSVEGATVDTLRFLVARGASVQARSKGGESAAWYAAGRGGRWWNPRSQQAPDYVERLQFLLDQGISPNDCSNRSLLAEACVAGDAARVKLLLQRGAVAQLGAVSPLGADVSKDAASEHRLRRLVTLAESGDCQRGPLSEQIPICCAARSGAAECVRLLLEAGADPNTRDQFGTSALMVAGSAAVVRALLDAGADRDAVDACGRDAGECILSGDRLAVTPVNERLEAARALLGESQRLEGRSAIGDTRLANAAFERDADAVDALLAVGAPADARDSEGATPLHAVCWHGEYSRPESNLACERIIRALVKAGTPIDGADDDGDTALHYAALGDWGNSTAVRVLVELGAAVDLPNKRGCTPLMLAATRGELPSIEALCAAGADPTRLNAAGESALDAARWFLSLFDVGHALRPNAEAALARLEGAAARRVGAG